MADPLSDPSISSLLPKVVSGLGGLIGGVTFMAFYKPRNVWDAAVRSSVSTASAIIGCIPVLNWMNMPINIDYMLAASAVLGFCAWSILSLAARTLLKIQDEKTTVKLPEFIERKK